MAYWRLLAATSAAHCRPSVVPLPATSPSRCCTKACRAYQSSGARRALHHASCLLLPLTSHPSLLQDNLPTATARLPACCAAAAAAAAAPCQPLALRAAQLHTPSTSPLPTWHHSTAEGHSAGHLSTGTAGSTPPHNTSTTAHLHTEVHHTSPGRW